MIDHSAFDAYMFIIEAEGTRFSILVIFAGMVSEIKAQQNATKVCLQHKLYISEGTNVSRSNVAMQTERELQQDLRINLSKINTISY